MKLVFCPHCQDVVKPGRREPRVCNCGESGGEYIDDVNCIVYGAGTPLGFANTSFVSALKSRPKGPGKGSRFEAWVMPRKVDSIFYRPITNRVRYFGRRSLNKKRSVSCVSKLLLGLVRLFKRNKCKDSNKSSKSVRKRSSKGE